MLHHVSLPVADLKRAAQIYDAGLAALGYRCVARSGSFLGYGTEDGKDKFALKLSTEPIVPNSRLHVAFAAPSSAAVDRFHAAAVSAGAKDCGKPGLRAHYGPHYYAAFIEDADGHRIEAFINSQAE